MWTPRTPGTTSTTVSRRVTISDEPIINAVHRHVLDILVAFYVVLLIYCSLLPFDFCAIADLCRSTMLRIPMWLGLSLGPVRLLDILVNIALYLLLGAGLMRIQVLRRGRVLPSGLVTMLVCVGISLMVELLQRQTISRNGSWVDLTSNTLGAGLGVLLVTLFGPQLRRFGRDLQAGAERNWWLAVAKVLVSVILVAQLRPYDLVLDLKRTAQVTWRDGDLHPAAYWDSLPERVRLAERIGRARMSELPRVQWEYALDRVVDTALYTSAAAVLTVGLWVKGRRRLGRFLATGVTVGLLATVITIVRVFLITYGLDTAHLVCAAIGLPVGWLFGEVAIVSMRKERGLAHGAATPLLWPHGVHEFVPACVIVLVAAYGLAPFDLSPYESLRAEQSSQVHWMPMLRQYRSLPNIYFMSTSGDLIRFGCLAMALSFLTRPYENRAWRHHLMLVVMTTATIAAIVELLHALMPSRSVDVTHVILSVFGGLAGAIALRWASDYRHFVQHCRGNDLLTSQLVSGTTYESGGFKLPRWLHADASRKGRGGFRRSD